MTKPRYLRAIQVVADRELVERFCGGFVARFDREVLWLTLAYEAYLQQRVATTGIPKLFITWTDQPCETTNKPFAPMAIRRQFPFAYYRDAEPAAKKILLLNQLHGILLDTALQCGWDAGPFEEARGRLIQCQLTPRLVIKQAYRHPQLRATVRLSCELDLDEFRIACELVDLQGRLLGPSVFAGKGLPIHDPVGGYLQGAHWLDDDSFQTSGSSFHGTAFRIDFSAEIQHLRDQTENPSVRQL